MKLKEARNLVKVQPDKWRIRWTLFKSTHSEHWESFAWKLEYRPDFSPTWKPTSYASPMLFGFGYFKEGIWGVK